MSYRRAIESEGNGEYKVPKSFVFMQATYYCYGSEIEEFKVG